MLSTGRTRELAVFGFIGDTELVSRPPSSSRDRYVVYGIIDEIERRPALGYDDNDNDISKDITWHLSDTKTRVQPRLPNLSSARASKLQLMLYKRLFDSLTRGPLAFDAAAFFDALHV